MNFFEMWLSENFLTNSFRVKTIYKNGKVEYALTDEHGNVLPKEWVEDLFGFLRPFYAVKETKAEKRKF